MRQQRAFVLVTIWMLAACVWNPTFAQELPARTALDDYVAKKDGSYTWRIVSDDDSGDVRTVVVDFVSQTWRTTDDVDRPQWQHWLTMAIPKNVRTDIGLLWIGGGSNGGNPPSGPSDRVRQIAAATGSVVAELKMVPNQPLVFHQDGQRRTEDDLVAYTWDQYLKTGDPTWPARNPMVKSAVRAMDTITAVTSTDVSNRAVKRFVVTGGSKRGWTTWLTGAVDDRVVGIAPIVIDVLNVDANTRNHFAAYGFWAPSVGDYVEHRILERMEHKRMHDLLELVDPWYYRHRLTMPKFILNASGDQFFPPDSSRFYFDDLVGQKHLRYVPNADHGLGGSDAIESLTAWYWLILEGKTAPEFSWEDSPETIRVMVKDEPKEVRLWQATNPDARDFRLESLGPKYTSRLLKPQEDGVYVADVPPPEKGWTAYFVELTWDVGAPVAMKATTPIRIAPDVLPFADRDPKLPATITLDLTAPNQVIADLIQKSIHAEKVKAIASDMLFSQPDSDAVTGQVGVQLNWKPIGSFRKSGEAIIGWLQEQGCTDFHYRLESGPLRKENHEVGAAAGGQR